MNAPLKELGFKIARLPKELQATFTELYTSKNVNGNRHKEYLAANEIHHGDARELLSKIEPKGLRTNKFNKMQC